MTLDRRRFLASTAAIGATAGLGLGRAAEAAAAAAAGPLKMALIVPSPAADVGWSHTLAAGLEAVKARLGGDTTLTLIENIPDGPEFDRIMQKTVADGHNFIVAGSFGYQNGALQVARRNPDVTVLHASGYQVGPNFSNFAARYYQGLYLLGMAAAALSKTGKLGSVSAFAIPELITSVNAFALGARAVNPAAQLSVVWVNSWFDPAKEQNAAKALLAQGNDVIFSNAQDTPSVVSACEEAGAYVCNLNSSMKKYAPKKYLGCVSTDWAPYFQAEADARLAGTFKGASHWLGIADKVVIVEDLSPDLPAEMRARIDDTQAQIVAGTFNPFQGPLKDAAGTEVVPAGSVLADDKILAMDWHVEGVVTPLPK